MRSEDVVTNFTCNQACRFCHVRLPVDSVEFASSHAVLERIADAVRRGGERIVLTGGEPTLRRELPRWVAAANKLGAREVWLETNATLLDEPRVRSLVASGLHAVRVHLSGFDASLDRTTRDPGGFVAAQRGLDCLLATTLPVELVSVLSRSSLSSVSAMPEPLSAFLSGRRRIRCWWIVVPTRLPETEEMPSAAELLAYIPELIRAGREVSLPIKLDPRSAFPPCLFTDPGRLADAFSLTPGGLQQPGFSPLPACSGCVLRDRCPGVNDAHRSWIDGSAARPIEDERLRRRMTLISTVEEQVMRELVEPSTFRDDAGRSWEEAIIRVGFRCNQRCRFCFVSTHLPDASRGQVLDAIERAAERGARIVISGGEPMLHPNIDEYLQRAVAKSVHPVQIQTNAVCLASGDGAERCASVGVKQAFVSLHAASARVSDTITGAPGTFEKTLLGIDRLVSAGIGVTLNFVVFRSNLGELSSWVRLCATRWPGVHLNISFVAPATDVVPLDEETVPRYSEALPVIADAVHLAKVLGVDLGGFESMCGLPLCLVPGELVDQLDLEEIPPGFDRGEFVKPPACKSCAIATRCFGVRSRYVELYGAAELKPLSKG